MGKKLVIIGAGSSYTPELIDGIIRRKETIDLDEIQLVDIPAGQERLTIIYNLTVRMLEKARMPVRVFQSTDRQKALIGADFVLTQIRVGGMDSRIIDETLPIKCNMIGQETTGAGGFSKAVRTIPEILSICKDIELYAKDAVLINFTNPAGIVTEAINKYTSVKVLGLCNVPINMKANVAKMMDYDIEQVYMEFLGLNHFVYGTKVTYKGEDVTGDVLDKLIDGGSVTMNNIPDLKWNKEIIEKLQMVPCPYHKYFYLKDEMLEDELKKYKAKGITRGVEVKAIEKTLFEKYSEAELSDKPVELEARGGSLYSEAAISLIDAIVNNRGDIHTLNVTNEGIIPGLSNDSVIEMNCRVYADHIERIQPEANLDRVEAIVKQVKAYERKTILATVNKDYQLALEAMKLNPLVDEACAESLLKTIIKENNFDLV